MTYHVQTEDKGHDSPLILSLIYTGGTILASKRTPYEDLLVGGGLDERLLAERLNRQHTLICAAIRAGRIDDLKKLNEKNKSSVARQKESPVAAPPPAAVPPPITTPVAPPPIAAQAVPPPPKVETVTAPLAAREERRVVEPKYVTDRTLASLVSDVPPPGVTGPLQRDIASLQVYLLNERDLKSGEPAVLRVKVGRGLNGTDPAAAAEVSIKILGTTFQPVVVSLKTNEQGLAAARVNLPQFTAGRAAILVRAVCNGEEAMLRRVIQRY